MAVIAPILWLRRLRLRKIKETWPKSHSLYVVEARFQLRSVWVQSHVQFSKARHSSLCCVGSPGREDQVLHTCTQAHRQTLELGLLPVQHGISTCKVDWGGLSTLLRVPTPSKRQSFPEASAGGEWSWYTILFRAVLHPRMKLFPYPNHLRTTFQMGDLSRFSKKQGLMDASSATWKTCFLCYSHFMWRFVPRLHWRQYCSTGV